MSWFGAGLIAVILAGCGYDVAGGRAFGTTYAIQASCPKGVPRQLVKAELAQINRQMSTFDAASELSLFNRAPLGVAMPVSPALAEVAAAAQRIAIETSGAFDATVAPLVALWGFGADAADHLPTAAQLREARLRVGYQRLELGLDPPTLKKTAALTLDLSGIAKGYAVDRLAMLLDQAACSAYLIELGGEVRVFGSSPDGGPWRVAIDSPEDGQLGEVLALRAGAVATSGDYRQRRADAAARATHIIDPRTGQPVTHRLASVTVVADQALYADAYATALIVMGEVAGFDFAERRGLAALFIVRAASGLAVRRTSAMQPLLAESAPRLLHSSELSVRLIADRRDRRATMPRGLRMHSDATPSKDGIGTRQATHDQRAARGRG